MEKIHPKMKIIYYLMSFKTIACKKRNCMSFFGWRRNGDTKSPSYEIKKL